MQLRYFDYRKKTKDSNLVSWCNNEFTSDGDLVRHLKACKRCEEARAFIIPIVYLEEIEEQCEHVAQSILALQDAVLNDNHPTEIFRRIHTVLTFTANISRLLWPSSKRDRTQERGRSLRDMLGLPDDHILAERTFRNHFEHFDERLDTWAQENSRLIMLDGIISPGATIREVIGGVSDKENVLRRFDDVAGKFYFGDDELDLRTLAKVVGDVWDRILDRLPSTDDWKALREESRNILRVYETDILPKVSNTTFVDEVVTVDLKTFENCTFKDCVFLYKGYGHPYFTKCSFMNPQLDFDGIAQNTAEFIARFYNAGEGGAKLVQNWLSQHANREYE